MSPISCKNAKNFAHRLHTQTFTVPLKSVCRLSAKVPYENDLPPLPFYRSGVLDYHFHPPRQFHTVNLGVLPEHQNRCKFLQLYTHRFGANLNRIKCYLVLSYVVVWTQKLCKLIIFIDKILKAFSLSICMRIELLTFKNANSSINPHTN